MNAADPPVDAAPVAPAADVAALPIRLLKFVTLFGIGGTERQVVNLVRHLDRARFDPAFACLRRWGHFLEDIERQQIPVSEYHINSFYRPGTLRQLWRLARDMRCRRIQIAHSYNFYANVFAVPAARLAGVPVVVASVRDTGMNLTPAKMRVHQLFCRMADCILVNADAVRDWLVGQGADAENIRVIRNGLDLTRFTAPADGAGLRRELGLPPQAPVVLVLARLTPQKGIEVFLDAAAAVSQRFPAARFLVVGDVFTTADHDGVVQRDTVYPATLRRRAERLGIGERVVFAGFRSDVAQLLSQAAVSVLPSISGEGLSNTLIESMAAGVPVVATRVGGSPEVVERDGIDGLLVAPRDPEALAQAIGAVLGDRERARRLGEEGRRRATQRFALARMVRETEDLYENLLAQSMRKRGFV